MTDYNYKYRSAFFLFDMGYLDEAYEVVLEVHLNEPRDPVFLKGLALIEESRGNIKGVISAREQMSIFDPWNTDNYLALLKLYKNNGDLNNATAMKDKIISFAPGTEIAKTAIEIFG
jgi:tetratricopeptide (TPR) repeat protein